MHISNQVSQTVTYYKAERTKINRKHNLQWWHCLMIHTVYPKKYAHGFVVLCFVVVMQSSIMKSHEVFIHIHQGCFAGTGAIVRLPQCQWSKPDGYGKISQCIITTKHSKAKTVCIFLGIYCKSIKYACGYSVLFFHGRVRSGFMIYFHIYYRDATLLLEQSYNWWLAQRHWCYSKQYG